MKIKDLEKDARPRERLIKYGVNSLTDIELLAVILNTGTKDLDVLSLSNKILNEYNLKEFSNLSYDELVKIKGISTRKATLLISIFEFVKRISKEKNHKKLTSTKLIFDYIRHKYLYVTNELLTIIYLNYSLNIIYELEIKSDFSYKVDINIKNIIKQAVIKKAEYIILVHNHPSGEIKPSIEDITFTNKLQEALKLLDITLIEHLIINNDDYFSFYENNYLIKD